MLKSMTAFGAANKAASFGQIHVEIRVVNRKHLEISCSLPQELNAHESSIRSKVSSKLQRGNVQVWVKINWESEEASTVTVNVPLAKKMKKAADLLAEELFLSAKADLSFYLKQPQILKVESNPVEIETLEEEVMEAIDLALLNVVSMQKKEGESQQRDFETRLSKIIDCHRLVIQKLPEVVPQYQEKLLKRLSEFLKDIAQDERFLKEVALFADRVDISEEVTRLSSHFEQLKAMLDSKEVASGKKIEFLLQEMLREWNTLGTKSPDIAIVQLAIDAKTEIEKLKEQVQNVE